MNEQDQSITTLRNLLISDAHRFRGIEVELKKMLPEWISNAHSTKLKEILAEYLSLVQGHIRRMDALFAEEKPGAVGISKSIVRVFAEYLTEKLSNCTDTKLKDTSLLTSIQAINHFKISMYETAGAFAHLVRMDNYAAFFHDAELKEKQIEVQLSQLSIDDINLGARASMSMTG